MGRRAFIAACGAALALRLGAGRAQEPRRIPRLGVIASSAASSPWYDGLRQGLRDLGYVEGKNIAIEWRFADGQYERLPAIAAELVGMKVDAIHAGGGPASLAVQRATKTIPVVIAGVGDPVALGLVGSLSRPEANITGVSLQVVDVSVKHLEFLRAVVPGLSRVAVLHNPSGPVGAPVLQEIQAAAKASKVGVSVFTATSIGEIDTAFGAIARGRYRALIGLADPLLNSRARQITELAAKARLATIFPFREYVDAGGLMSYGEVLGDNYRRSATYVHKILNGARPGDLPVEQPTKVSLFINRRTARALGLAIPQQLLLRADEVIE